MPDLDRFRPYLWAATALCFLAAVVAIPIVADDGSSDGPPSRTGLLAGDGGDAGTVGDGGGDPPVEGATTTTPGACLDGCGGGGDDPDGSPIAGAPPTSSAVPATAASAAPAPTAATAAPTTTAAPPADLGAAQDPGPTKAPRPGTYRYKATTNGETSDATTQVEDRGTQGGETRQLVKQRSKEGGLDNDVAWRPDGLYVLSSVLSFGTTSFNCDWNPDTLELELPLAAGATWTATSSCTISYGAQQFVITRTVTGKVLDLRRTKVGDQTVDVWAIESTNRIDAAGKTTNTTGTTLFSPKHGLIVRSDTTTTTPEGSKQTTLEAQNLDPE